MYLTHALKDKSKNMAVTSGKGSLLCCDKTQQKTSYSKAEPTSQVSCFYNKVTPSTTFTYESTNSKMNNPFMSALPNHLLKAPLLR